MAKSKKVAPNPALNKPVVIRRAGGEYFPNKPIWLVFDQSNGHKPSRRYVWWFDTKKDADEWTKEHLENKSGHAYDISKPVRWKPCV
jgi:hypothetical protein